MPLQRVVGSPDKNSRASAIDRYMQEVLQSKPFLAVHCRSTLAQILRRDKKDGKKNMARWPLKDHERYWFKDEVVFSFRWWADYLNWRVYSIWNYNIHGDRTYVYIYAFVCNPWWYMTHITQYFFLSWFVKRNLGKMFNGKLCSLPLVSHSSYSLKNIWFMAKRVHILR